METEALAKAIAGASMHEMNHDNIVRRLTRAFMNARHRDPWRSLASLMVLLTGLASQMEAVPMPTPMSTSEFSILTNILSQRAPFGMVNISPTVFALTYDQQMEVNSLALGIAKDLQDASGQRRYNFAYILNQLAQRGLLSEPKLIPYLLDALRLHDNDLRGNATGGVNSLRVLCIMTRRMLGAVVHGGRDLSENRSRIVSWWEQWWKENHDKHPVYDEEIDRQVRDTYLKIGKTIERAIRPHFAELRYYTFQTDLPPRPSGLYVQTVLYEDHFLSYRNSMDPTPLERSTMLEVVCCFEGAEMPPVYLGSDHAEWHLPRQLESFRTNVCSRHIDDSDIRVEVNVATSNRALVDALKKTLSPEY